MDSKLDLAWGYPSVFQDSESGKWRCLYQGHDVRLNRSYPLLAESTDGFRWRVPDLSGILDFPERTYPNQVLPVGDFTEWSPCFFDTHAPRQERLKGLVFSQRSRQPASFLWVSSDGIRWRQVIGVEWQRNTPDPVTCAFWNKARARYVLTTRPSMNDRRIAVMETQDWRTFSNQNWRLRPIRWTLPCAEFYGMPVFQYEGFYVGLLWIYHVPPQVIGSRPSNTWEAR